MRPAISFRVTHWEGAELGGYSVGFRNPENFCGGGGGWGGGGRTVPVGSVYLWYIYLHMIIHYKNQPFFV